MPLCAQVKASLIIGIIITLFNAGCGSSIELASHYHNGGISMDGSDSSWHQSMHGIEDSRIALGFRHDDKHIYVCVAPMQRSAAMQIVMMGLTVWFDSSAGKNKTFGIHFPIGLAGYGLTPRMLEAKKENGGSLEQAMKSRLQELEILRPNELDQIRIDLKDLQGITVKMILSKEGMIYVLKVPLQITENYPYAIRSKLADKISVGFETGEMKMGLGEGPPRGGMGGEGGGQRGGGMRGGGMPGGGMRPGMGDRPKPIKLWTTVDLSEKILPSK